MAFPICSSSSSSRAFFSRASFPLSSFGIRLPLVGAFCVLSLGLTNLSPALAFKTGCAQSHSFLPFLRSKFTGQSYPKASHSTGMESSAGTGTIPSIVVYVTVPNKKAEVNGEMIIKVYKWKSQTQAGRIYFHHIFIGKLSIRAMVLKHSFKAVIISVDWGFGLFLARMPSGIVLFWFFFLLLPDAICRNKYIQ